jgi:hypothetical protein
MLGLLGGGVTDLVDCKLASVSTPLREGNGRRGEKGGSKEKKAEVDQGGREIEGGRIGEEVKEEWERGRF